MASVAIPAVYNFLLYEKDEDISQSKSGNWIKKISKGGKHIYSCIALQVVGNVTSSNNVTLTVNGEFCQGNDSFNFNVYMNLLICKIASCVYDN